MTATTLSPFTLMDDNQLTAALASLEHQVAQLAFLREPAPAALRTGLVDALDRARSEIERRKT